MAKRKEHVAIFDLYEVTADGRILSVGTNWRGYGRRELSQIPHKDGYLTVRLVVDGKRKRCRVHQLVCAAFHGPRPTDGHEVRHLDGSRTNNHKDNLRWGTRSENARDRVRHGTQYMPPWDDPAFAKRMTASMRRAHQRNRETRGADNA